MQYAPTIFTTRLSLSCGNANNYLCRYLCFDSCRPCLTCRGEFIRPVIRYPKIQGESVAPTNAYFDIGKSP